MRTFKMRMLTLFVVCLLAISPMTTFASTIQPGGVVAPPIIIQKITIHTLIVLDQVIIEGTDDHFQWTENGAFTEADIVELKAGIDLSGEDDLFLQGLYWDAKGNDELTVGDVPENGDTLYILLTTIEPTVTPNPPQNPEGNTPQIPEQDPPQSPVNPPQGNSGQGEEPIPQPETQEPATDVAAPKTGQSSLVGLYVVVLFAGAVFVAGVRRKRRDFC